MYKFLKLEQNNTIRFITSPFKYMAHTSHSLSNNWWEQRLVCNKSISNDFCLLCQEGYKPEVRFIAGIINRDKNELYLIDFGLELFYYIGELAKHKLWGQPDTYDIDIINYIDEYDWREYFQAIPLIKSMLSKEDQKLQSEIDLKYLEDICDPSKIKINKQLLLEVRTK